VAGDFWGLEEKVLGLYELREFAVEPFQQWELPIFAFGDAPMAGLAKPRCGVT
jgi:hypothetical protein